MLLYTSPSGMIKEDIDGQTGSEEMTEVQGERDREKGQVWIISDQVQIGSAVITQKERKRETERSEMGAGGGGRQRKYEVNLS